MAKRPKTPVQRQPDKTKSLTAGLEVLTALLHAQSKQFFLAKLTNSDWKLLGTHWMRAAWAARDEILADLEPLLDQINKSKARKALETLIHKVNGIGLKPHWIIWPAVPILTVRSKKPPIVVKIENPAWMRLGPGQGTIEIGGKRYIVLLSIMNWRNAREFLYGVMILAIQSGNLQHLRRCHWKRCNKYFFTADLRRKKYCSADCADASDRADAPERVRKWRAQ